MRVTQSMMTRTLLSNLNKSRESMNSQQVALSSGKNVQSASDDPVKFATSTRYKETYIQNEKYLDNILDAKGWVDTTSSVVDDMYSYVVSAKDIAYRAVDASSDSQTKDILAGDLDVIIDELYSLANSKYLGKYLFGGTNTIEETPFSYDGSTVSYVGNDGAVTRRISASYDATINIGGNEIIDSQVFENLINLRDALLNDDAVTISDSIETLEQSAENILSIQSRVGSLSNLLTMTENRLNVANTNLSSMISDVEDADITQVIAKYNSDELAYEAALQVTSDILNLNILDFI